MLHNWCTGVLQSGVVPAGRAALERYAGYARGSSSACGQSVELILAARSGPELAPAPRPTTSVGAFLYQASWEDASDARLVSDRRLCPESQPVNSTGCPQKGSDSGNSEKVPRQPLVLTTGTTLCKAQPNCVKHALTASSDSRQAAPLLTCQAAGLTHIGYGPLKKENQDFIFVEEDSCLGPGSSTFGVFDGHGAYGRILAQRSSQLLPQLLGTGLDKLRRMQGNGRDAVAVQGAAQQQIGSVFTSAFLAADERVCMSDGVDATNSGTTASIAHVQGTDLWVASVGDSGCILVQSPRSADAAEDDTNVHFVEPPLAAKAPSGLNPEDLLSSLKVQCRNQAQAGAAGQVRGCQQACSHRGHRAPHPHQLRKSSNQGSAKPAADACCQGKRSRPGAAEAMTVHRRSRSMPDHKLVRHRLDKVLMTMSDLSDSGLHSSKSVRSTSAASLDSCDSLMSFDALKSASLDSLWEDGGSEALPRTVPLTALHRAGAPQERQRLLAAGARVHPKRLPGGANIGEPRLWLRDRDTPGLLLSRALGDRLATTVGCTPRPAVTHCSLRPGRDAFLVLASDGVWDVLSTQQVADIVMRAQSPRAACRRMLRHALRRWQAIGAADNVAVVVVALRWDSENCGAAGTGALSTAPPAPAPPSPPVPPARAVAGRGRGRVQPRGDAQAPAIAPAGSGMSSASSVRSGRSGSELGLHSGSERGALRAMVGCEGLTAQDEPESWVRRGAGPSRVSRMVYSSKEPKTFSIMECEA